MGSAAPPPPIPTDASMSNGKRSWLFAAIIGAAFAIGFVIYMMRPSQTFLLGTSIDGAETNKLSNSKADESIKPPEHVGELADLVAGNYHGEVISDSQGGSRSDIAVTVAKIDRSKVRVAADYQRMGTIDITLTRTGNQITNAGGDTVFMVDLDRNPPTLDFKPRNELAYRGNKQK